MATELATERFRLAADFAIEGRSPHPDGAAFVAADLAELGSIVALATPLRRRLVVLVCPDGDERILTPGQLPEQGAA